MFDGIILQHLYMLKEIKNKQNIESRKQKIFNLETYAEQITCI